MNFILPIILIASSFAVFFGYVDPNYKGGTNLGGPDYSKSDIVFLKGELAKYSDILNSSTKIVSQRDVLVAKKNTITDADTKRLEKLLPSNIDNIRLIIEISKIAEGRNLIAKNISVGDMSKTASDTIGGVNTPYGTLSLKFTVNSSYNNFLNFLQDLENNLRLLDITDISFNATDSGFYDFTVSLNTYWLK
jgi:Tfp pilus assembly protein PilO